MTIRIGEVDVAKQLLENEFRIAVLERVVDRLIQSIPIIGGAISRAEMDGIRKEAVQQLQAKYPNSAIGLKESPNAG